MMRVPDREVRVLEMVETVAVAAADKVASISRAVG